MSGRLGPISIEVSGAFGEGDRFIVQIEPESDDWFYTNLTELQDFMYKIMNMVNEEQRKYAPPS